MDHITIGWFRWVRTQVRHAAAIAQLRFFFQSLSIKAYGLFYDRSGLYLSLIALVVLLVLTVDHLTVLKKDWILYFSQFGLILFFFSTAYLLMKISKLMLSERARQIQVLDQENQLSDRLVSAIDDVDTYHHVLQFASAFFPGQEAELYIYNDEKHLLDPADGCASCREISDWVDVNCLSCLFQVSRQAHPFTICQRKAAQLRSSASIQSCLALHDDTRLVGMLAWKTGKDEAPSNEQMDVIENISPTVANALAAVLEKKKRTEVAIAQARMSVQIEIARDLHDTLSQNIAYIRMVLENLEEIDPNRWPETRAKLVQMHSVTTESYDLLRGTLSILQADEFNKTVIEELFSNHARVVSERYSIPIEVISRGTSQVIPAKMRRQLFYIYREALNNIEMHAKAKRVDVIISWERNHITIDITDDGIGISPHEDKKAGHYGLEFMRARVKEMNGQFALNSIPGKGTNINIRVPVEPRNLQ